MSRHIFRYIVVTLLCVIIALMLSGCATRLKVTTYANPNASPEQSLKTTILEATGPWGIPCLFSGTFAIKDGDFEVSTKAAEVPDFDLKK